MRPVPPRRLAPFMLFLVMVPPLFVGMILPSRFTVTTTESLDHRIFWISKKNPQPEHLQKGDYVRFTHTHPWDKSGKAEDITKRVSCVEGELLKATDALEYFCDGDFLGKAWTSDSRGNQLEGFSFNGVVPAGKIFVSGTHERSYDSRYFGFIDSEKVRAKLLPLF